MNLSEGQFRIVKNKSIPNVDSDRLRGDLGRLHQRFHTTEGLHEHDGPRRDLIDNGIKGLKIKAELDKRGESSGIDGCRWCS